MREYGNGGFGTNDAEWKGNWCCVLAVLEWLVMVLTGCSPVFRAEGGTKEPVSPLEGFGWCKCRSFSQPHCWTNKVVSSYICSLKFDKGEAACLFWCTCWSLQTQLTFTLEQEAFMDTASCPMAVICLLV